MCVCACKLVEMHEVISHLELLTEKCFELLFSDLAIDVDQESFLDRHSCLLNLLLVRVSGAEIAKLKLLR